MSRTALTLVLLVVGLLLMLAAVLQHLNVVGLHVQHLALYEAVAALLALGSSVVLVLRSGPRSA